MTIGVFMRVFNLVILLTFLFFGGTILYTQTHVSVPLGHEVYYILEQAEARFLCPPLPAVKPYTRGRIVEAINEILTAESGRFGGLSSHEKQILENTRNEFTKGEKGLDLQNGMYRFDTPGKKGIKFSGDMGIAMESLNSVAYYMENKEPYYGTDTWATFFFMGDVGENFSLNLDFSGGLILARRIELGEYDTFATEVGFDPTGERVNRRFTTYSQPMAFFPYTYQKQWDGFMFGIKNDISSTGMSYWPEQFSIAPRMLAEITGSVFGDMLLLRFGRHQREWGAMTPGSSLVYNAAARPFLGVEALFNPVSWFSFSTITGVLEIYNGYGGIYDAPMTFQNAFSLYQLELNYKNYFHIDFGTGAIWPKRFELGYLFPLMDNFLNQNLIGKTDNTAAHINLKGRYPGLGSIWFSFFADEMEISSMGKAFELDRHMFAFQTGLQGMIPLLPFASFTLSYTKVEPYTYTHLRHFLPWYDRTNGPMEKAYVNNGVSLGHYLPPNSDEIKLRVESALFHKTEAHFQYQLIRHGADFGPHQVDGSSLISEPDIDRDIKKSLTKSFLNDGAYQWTHIVKVGGEYKFGSLPLTIFGEAGVSYFYFTDISNAEYEKYNPTPAGETPRPPAAGEYRTTTAFILTLGFRIFR
jgi:hypothetical protein